MTNQYKKIAFVDTNLSNEKINDYLLHNSFSINKLSKDNINQVIESLCLNPQNILITNTQVEQAPIRIAKQIFSPTSFLEFIISNNENKFTDYDVLSIHRYPFDQIDISDVFFDTLKRNYPEFEEWYQKKASCGETAYACIDDENNLLAFLYLKIEGTTEPYQDFTPILPPKRRLKVGTFKVDYNGYRLGERFIKIITDNALNSNVDEIYVTAFNKTEEQKRLISLLETWGFYKWGIKGNGELVFIKSMNNFVYDEIQLEKNYPFIKTNDHNIYITPIYEAYHSELFPDSKLNSEIVDSPITAYKNSIKKIYISRAIDNHPKKGDILIFYRTGGYYKSVVTTLCVVNDVKENFIDETDFVKYCKKISVFSDKDLIAKWNYQTKHPFAVSLLYIYSFPKRINMKRLIELRILKGINDAPRGFKKITLDQLNLILQETNTNESFIIN